MLTILWVIFAGVTHFNPSVAFDFPPGAFTLRREFFMGLGAAFLTLIVAETFGVKSGLGWYVSWAQGWAEYGKVYAALVIMAAFFSTIMTLLFKIRDRVLVWQKGSIRW